MKRSYKILTNSNIIVLHARSYYGADRSRSMTYKNTCIERSEHK